MALEITKSTLEAYPPWFVSAIRAYLSEANVVAELRRHLKVTALHIEKENFQIHVLNEQALDDLISALGVKKEQ